jgi:GntR family transcriptional regulator
VLTLDTTIPLYVQLSDLFRGRIARGDWPVGMRIPSLEQLMASFGVSRMTLRQAIDVLQREGLLSAERGRGTFVSASPRTDRPLEVETTLADLARMYRDTQPTILEIQPLSLPPPLEPGDGTPADAYMHMRRVHAQGGRPYNVISIFMARDVFDLAPERFRTETVVSVMQELPRVEIARARQTLTIGTADVEVAGLLGVPINSPVAEVRRVFGDPSGRVIYLGLITYRGDFVRVEMDLKA